MLHSTTPITFILCSREEVVPAITINLVIYETTIVSLARLVGILPPSTLFPILHFTLVTISVLVFDAEFALAEIYFFDLRELIINFLWVIGMLLWLYFAYLILYYGFIFGLFVRLLYYLDLFLLYPTLYRLIDSCFGLSLLHLKKLFIVDLATFEELHGILMKLLLSNLLPHLEYLSIKKGLSSLTHEQLYKFGVVELHEFVYGGCVHYDVIYLYLNVSVMGGWL